MGNCLVEHTSPPPHPWARAQLSALLIAAVAAVFVGLVTWQLYGHTVDLMTANLKDCLLGIVRTGSAQFDVRDLDALRREEDWKRPEWAKVVTQLRRIREENDQVLFAYIFRRSASGAGLEFVSDADSLDPYAKIDLNHDGKIDGADQLQFPGQPYDEAPVEAFAGFGGPLTTEDLYQDQWGTEITGYAPIRDARGNAVAVLAVDMKADDFLAITRQTLRPFLAFIVVLFCILVLLVFALMSLWRRQVAVLREVDRRKDEVLSLVSHQLQSPVNGIRLMIEDIQPRLPPGLQEEAGAMRAATARVLELVTMLLHVARARLGRVQVRPVAVDLEAFFADLTAFTALVAKDRGVELQADVPLHLPRATLDVQLTRMVLENLLSNAVKYTPKGGRVSLRVEAAAGRLRVRVADTGIGIPKEERRHIFENGFRAGNTADVAGNGFGLYIAKAAVEAQGGSLGFTTADGEGTTFTVDLPLSSTVR